MRALQNADAPSRIAFDYGMWGFNNVHKRGCYFQSAFDLEFFEDVKVEKETLQVDYNCLNSYLGIRQHFLCHPMGLSITA
jgi:hypothetical protein